MEVHYASALGKIRIDLPDSDFARDVRKDAVTRPLRGLGLISRSFSQAEADRTI
jgi:hypothetical protein